MAHKYLIINADDFGVSKSVNEAIISLLEDGRISSATLMPNVKYYNQAAKWARDNKDKVGLHLTFVNDDSEYKHKSLSDGWSIHDRYGYLYEDVNEFRSTAKLKDVKKEIEFQINKLKQDDINITHIDLHRYSIYPTINPILYLSLCNKARKSGNLPVRWARNGGYKIYKGVNDLCDSDNASKFFAAITDLYGLPIPDYVFKFPYRNVFKTYDEKKESFIKILSNLPDGISEIHIHPAIESDEIKEINPTWRERVDEYNLMFDDEISKYIIKNNIEIISYKNIKNIKKRNSKIYSILQILRYGIAYGAKKMVGKTRN